MHLARGVTAWVPTHTPKLLVTRPVSVFAFLTYHACRSPSGTWPSHGSYLSQWVSNGGVCCRVPTPYAQIPHELGLSLLELGVWLGNHLSRLLSLFGVPRLEASTPLPCRLLLCRLLPCRPLHGRSYPWVSGVTLLRHRHILGPNPANAQDWSTPLFTLLRP